MHRPRLTWYLCALTICATSTWSQAALVAAETIDYATQIKPLLASRCYACHGALKQNGGLRLDTAALIGKGGESGPAVLAGQSATSVLIERITDTNAETRMPPEGEGEPLKPAEVSLIKAWIDQGLKAPTDEKPETDPRDHWAFRAPVKPAIPQVERAGWSQNPIDAFIAAKHEQHGLTPLGDAELGTLIRRIYLDLTGLPPTLEELNKWERKLRGTKLKAESRKLGDNGSTRDSAAFSSQLSAFDSQLSALVNDLLASPQYGERWGRHWMDIWRYSDWWGLGAEVRNSQKHIWHWRDWIVESVNADLGYDEMLRQMLAADELYPTDADKLRATGFLARNYFKFNRTTWLDDVIQHTSKAFLGMTFNCSKCHDHKYDPLSQVEYYQLRAFFEPYQVRTDLVPGVIDFEQNGIPRAFDCNLDAPTFLHIRGDDTRPKKDQVIEPHLPAILAFDAFPITPVKLPATAHLPGLQPFVLDDHLKDAEQKIVAAQKAVEQAELTLKTADDQLQAAQQLANNIPAKPMSAVAEQPKSLIHELFKDGANERWTIIAGKWSFVSGKVVQSADGNVPGRLQLKQLPPADFEARLRFTITGGRQYRSVGIAFDCEAQHDTLVYLSGQMPGGKLQVSHKVAGKAVYPPQGAKSREVQSGKPIELTVRVRGTEIRVLIDGQPVLTYQQTMERRAGAIQLATYDAQVELHEFELRTIDGGSTEVKTATPPLADADRAQAQAKVALDVARKNLQVATQMPALLRARAAADRARFADPPAKDAGELAKQAARAERESNLLKAEAALAQGELDVLKAQPDKKAEAEKKVPPLKTAVETARKALDTPGDTYTSLRGSLKTLESNLESETSRSKPFPTTSTGRRTALARWITDPRHPLTARVAVNHIWSRHFGRPLVPTVFDFGRKGAVPTHPELLDFLACELVEHGWSMKHVHRLIVTSKVYRLEGKAESRELKAEERSSPATAQLSAVSSQLSSDPENRFYWRMPSRRMEAQIVRDALLHLAGELDLKLGGPSVPVSDTESRRRSLYYVHSHNDHQKFLSIFDDAGVQECYRRSESIVPQQALALANSKLAVTMAEKIAAKLSRDPATSDDAAFVELAWYAILASHPSAEERAACLDALAQFTKLATEAKRTDVRDHSRAALVHALLNHNDFVTIR
ncbi:MAG: PSD1 domain-containing protein [Planctomycetaceae bacterium]|nr:PSD1 domain-containing protein [Planctomycetaceae bacterium]